MSRDRLERVKRYFDAEALSWSAKYHKGSIFSQRLTCVLRMFDEESLVEGSVLDVGCGSGVVLSYILERGHVVYGVDISPKMINAADSYVRRTGCEVNKVNFSVVDGSRLAFEDAVFDATICCGVLEYTDNDGLLVSELSRVLKTGGFAILSVPNKSSFIRIIERFIFKHRAIIRNLPFVNPFIKHLNYLAIQRRQYRRSQFVALLNRYALAELEAQFFHIPGSRFRILDRLSHSPLVGMTYLTKARKVSQPATPKIEDWVTAAGRGRSKG